MKFLSEENYELRERLLKKEVEIEKLKIEETKTQENIVNKVLKKENCELHHENEQLKLERDKLRHLVNERQSKAEKLVAGMRGWSCLNISRQKYFFNLNLEKISRQRFTMYLLIFLVLSQAMRSSI